MGCDSPCETTRKRALVLGNTQTLARCARDRKSGLFNDFRTPQLLLLGKLSFELALFEINFCALGEAGMDDSTGVGGQSSGIRLPAGEADRTPSHHRLHRLVCSRRQRRDGASLEGICRIACVPGTRSVLHVAAEDIIHARGCAVLVLH